MEIFKDFTFESAHRLPNLPSTHKCSRLHGHTFQVRLYVKGQVTGEQGWLMDFADIESYDPDGLVDFMALLATASCLFAYLSSALAVLKLGREGRMPLSPALTVVAILAGLYAVFTLFGAGREAVMWGLVLLAMR